MASVVGTTTTTLATTTPSAGEQWEPEEVKPFFSAGDEVWVHVDSALGITPDDTTFIPRPGVVESSMDGVLYTVRGLDGESTSLLAGFEQMERDWPAFTPDESGGAGATKVKNPAPTMPSCNWFRTVDAKDMRHRNDVAFEASFRTHVQRSTLATMKEHENIVEGVYNLSDERAAELKAEVQTSLAQFADAKAYSKCPSEGCLVRHFTYEPDVFIVDDHANEVAIKCRWKWHSMIADDQGSAVDAIFKDQLDARWTCWDEAPVPYDLKQKRVDAQSAFESRLRERERNFDRLVARARKVARSAANAAVANAAVAGDAIGSYIELKCDQARAAARAAAHAADTASVGATAELKRVLFFERQRKEQEEAATRARLAREARKQAELKAKGAKDSDERERSARVRAAAASKQQARAAELAAKQAAAVEHRKRMKAARTLFRVADKAMATAVTAAEAADREASEAKAAADVDVVAVAAAAADAVSVATHATAFAAVAAVAAAASASEAQRVQRSRRKHQAHMRLLAAAAVAARNTSERAAAAAEWHATDALTVVEEAVQHQASEQAAQQLASNIATLIGDTTPPPVAEECQICYIERPQLTIKECGHTLCLECLEKWTTMTIKSSRSRTTCPFCRVSIKRGQGRSGAPAAWRSVPHASQRVDVDEGFADNDRLSPTDSNLFRSTSDDFRIPASVREEGARMLREARASAPGLGYYSYGVDGGGGSRRDFGAPSESSFGTAERKAPGLESTERISGFLRKAPGLLAGGASAGSSAGSSGSGSSMRMGVAATHSSFGTASSFTAPPGLRASTAIPATPAFTIASAVAADAAAIARSVAADAAPPTQSPFTDQVKMLRRPAQPRSTGGLRSSSNSFFAPVSSQALPAPRAALPMISYTPMAAPASSTNVAHERRSRLFGSALREAAADTATSSSSLSRQSMGVFDAAAKSMVSVRTAAAAAATLAAAAPPTKAAKTTPTAKAKTKVKVKASTKKKAAAAVKVAPVKTGKQKLPGPLAAKYLKALFLALQERAGKTPERSFVRLANVGGSFCKMTLETRKSIKKFGSVRSTLQAFPALFHVAFCTNEGLFLCEVGGKDHSWGVAVRDTTVVRSPLDLKSPTVSSTSAKAAKLKLKLKLKKKKTATPSTMAPMSPEETAKYEKFKARKVVLEAKKREVREAQKLKKTAKASSTPKNNEVITTSKKETTTAKKKTVTKKAKAARKTKLCRLWKKPGDTCKFGSKCKFRHPGADGTDERDNASAISGTTGAAASGEAATGVQARAKAKASAKAKKKASAKAKAKVQKAKLAKAKKTAAKVKTKGGKAKSSAFHRETSSSPDLIAKAQAGAKKLKVGSLPTSASAAWDMI